MNYSFTFRQVKKKPIAIVRPMTKVLTNIQDCCCTTCGAMNVHSECEAYSNYTNYNFTGVISYKYVDIHKRYNKKTCYIM